MCEKAVLKEKVEENACSRAARYLIFTSIVKVVCQITPAFFIVTSGLLLRHFINMLIIVNCFIV